MNNLYNKSFKHFRISHYMILLKREEHVTFVEKVTRVQYESKNTFVVIWIPLDFKIKIQVDYLDKVLDYP